MSFRSLSDWRTQFAQSRVQDYNNLDAGDFVSAETAVIVSGPAQLEGGDIDSLVPIGLTQNFAVNQGKQIYTFNEIGSSKPFMVPGRTRTSANISRILFDGPSLMYAMSLTSVDGAGNAFISDLPQNIGGPNNDLAEDLPAEPWNNPADGVAYSVNPEGGASVADPGLFFINLRSSFFNKPLGLGVIFYDNEQEPYGGLYLEECYINGHNMSLASQAVVIMENVSLFATNLVPLNPGFIAKGGTSSSSANATP